MLLCAVQELRYTAAHLKVPQRTAVVKESVSSAPERAQKLDLSMKTTLVYIIHKHD